MKLLSASFFTVPLLVVAACSSSAGSDSEGEKKTGARTAIGKSDAIGSCKATDGNLCGGKSDGNCWCDDSCASIGDCCNDKATVCGSTTKCNAGAGTVVNETLFANEGNGMQCTSIKAHCVTNDLDACPVPEPFPPDFCKDGKIVAGAPKFTASTDGMECQHPTVHCVTLNEALCPVPEPFPPDFCKDGKIVAGDYSYKPSPDGKECQSASNARCVSGACQ